MIFKGPNHSEIRTPKLSCMDGENRLVGFSDCEGAGYYQYDANGERTYKLTGQLTYQNIGGEWHSYMLLDNPTLYASPYLVATPQGYTKHYYAESERIASRIGGGGLEPLRLMARVFGFTEGPEGPDNPEDPDNPEEPENPDDPDTPEIYANRGWYGETAGEENADEESQLQSSSLLAEGWEIVDSWEVWEVFERKQEQASLQLKYVMDCADVSYRAETDPLHLMEWEDEHDGEPDCYWYHPDHLGSSSWITYTDGEAVQHLHYLPWGEDYVDQRTTNWSALHTFSAKEKDVETGLSYFGSRYYSSDLSIWLSVDPMSDKYPSLSPYVYCANNPVKLVDPNGEDWYESEDGKTLEFIYGESGQREGYTNIGSHLGQEYKDRIKNGEYSTVSMSANFGNDDFVAQKAGECCKAAKQMCINRGGENSCYSNELAIVSAGVNGEAGGSGIPENFVFGIEKLCTSLENGIPVVAGVDYGPGSSNSINDGGDGMTDHYVAIIGVTLNFSKDNSTGKTSISGGNLRYANPGNNSSSDGLNPNNLFTINVSKNYRLERYVRHGVCFTVTNLRVKSIAS